MVAMFGSSFEASSYFGDRLFDLAVFVELRSVASNHTGLERVAAHGRRAGRDDEEPQRISGKFPHWTDADRS